jgi:leader peptidase (prepilin peptidase)/N-methyltransferase
MSESSVERAEETTEARSPSAAEPAAEREPPRRLGGAYLRHAAAVAALALVAACLVAFGLTALGALAAFAAVVLVVVSVTDLERRIIPNRIVLPATAIVLVGHTLADPGPEWALGALGASAFLFVAALISPQGMGMGDVKLALLIGALLGRGAAPALAIGSVLAVVPSIAILIRHGRAGRKMGFPFGPFLALGALIVLFAAPPE